MILKTKYDTAFGRDVFLYTMTSSELEVGVTDFGGIVQFIRVNTPRGKKNVCLGFDSISDYLESGSYAGAIIGRVANRISGAKFALGGIEYELDRNDGENCNHSGVNGYDKRFYEADIDGDALVLSLDSPDGDQGFPGRLVMRVRFELNGNALSVCFEAESDRDTLWNPTCHIYFNLGGEESGNVGDTELCVRADAYTPLSSARVPTGEVRRVSGTPFDFVSPHTIGERTDDVDLVLTGGYDHNLALISEHAATAICEKSGITLDLYTDMPGLQLYTGGGLNGAKGKSRRYYPYDAFCLEPQYFPNAVNTCGFVPPLLPAGEKREHFIGYVFSVN